ncbi:MAG: dTDP-4-dehydrorhamnose 3,5-epimerase [Pseudomonadota bacterium]
MQIDRFDLEGPLVIKPRRHGDARGWFTEHYNERALAQAGFEARFVQDNLSMSAKTGTLRGLHYQAAPQAQGKLVSVVRGAIIDVVVDVREGSPGFARHIRAELTAENGRQIWVPPGFLHGFVTLQPDTLVLYKVTEHYSAEHDGAVAWDDPDLAIDWGVAAPVLSDRDAAAPRLREIAPLFAQPVEA